MNELKNIGKNAKQASKTLSFLETSIKNKILNTAAKLLEENTHSILKANGVDIGEAIHLGIKGALLDRLKLSEARIKDMAEGLRQIASLDDPIGEILMGKKLPNGLVIQQQRVPIGVIGIIYEARPNVTSDTFGLCLKAGNAVILKGGKEAINSNKEIVRILHLALEENNIYSDAVQLVEDTARETTLQLMKMNKYIDVLIPRGGAGLIQSVVENSTIPVIETGVGNCHIYVDKNADLKKAVPIILNAKVQRPGVCNATETLLIHQDIAKEFIPIICNELHIANVEIRGDKTVCELYPKALKANETDWEQEYLDLILAVKIVKGLEEAIQHIDVYGTGHSEAIVTENYSLAKIFTERIDAAAVYVNASTRFTDGMEFGFGAEIGISTQKLHARGPMGLKELTSAKYIVMGTGQIRE